jgi:DNA-binding beta-propeller fold protein YncE
VRLRSVRAGTLAVFVVVAAVTASLAGSSSAAPAGCVRITLPSRPNSLALVGTRVWVALASGVQLFDLASCRAVGPPVHMPRRARVSAPPPRPGWVWGPDRAVVLAAKGRHLWIAGELTLYRASRATRKIVRSVTLYRVDRIGNTKQRVPLGVLGLTLSGGSLWTANLAEGDTFVYELGADSGAIKLKRPADSEIVGMTSAKGWVWAISHDLGTVLRIDPATGRFTRTTLPSAPHGIAAGAGYVWVAMYHESTILRVDPGTGYVDGEPIRVGFPPEPMAAAGNRLWAIPATGGFLANPRPHTVLEIDAESGRTLARFRAEGRPRAVVAVGDAAWVATSSPNALARFPGRSSHPAVSRCQPSGLRSVTKSRQPVLKPFPLAASRSSRKRRR